MREHVALVGSAPVSREAAPFDDDRFDIWSLCAPDLLDIPGGRWDAWFEMHQRPYLEGNVTGRDLPLWISQFVGPVYMRQEWEDIPDSIQYPRKQVAEMQRRATVNRNLYIWSSITFMLALAVWKDYKHVHVFGIEMNTNKYKYQKDNFEFWLGFAGGRGMTVELAEGCAAIDDAWVYGDDEDGVEIKQ